MSKVTVIIPAYNAQDNIEKSITSVCNQTIKNIEIIVVNDGSEDATKHVVELMAEKDHRIKLINQINSGVSEARNTGLKAATGEYIAFLDADDYVDVNMYEIMLQYAYKTGADLVECGYYSVTQQGEVTYNMKFKYEESSNIHLNVSNYLQNKNSRAFPWNKLYLRSAIQKINFPKFKFSEDYLFNLYVLDNIKLKITIPNQLYYYVAHNDSAVNKPFSVNKIDALYACEEANKFINSKFPDLIIYALVRLFDNIQNLYFQTTKFKSKENLYYGKKLVKKHREIYKSYNNIIKNSDIKFLYKIFLMIFNISPVFAHFLTKVFLQKGIN